MSASGMKWEQRVFFLILLQPGDFKLKVPFPIPWLNPAQDNYVLLTACFTHSGKTYFQSHLEVVCSIMHSQMLPKPNFNSEPNYFCSREWQVPSHQAVHKTKTPGQYKRLAKGKATAAV